MKTGGRKDELTEDGMSEGRRYGGRKGRRIDEGRE